jgi:hypothetical protein
MQDGLGCLPHSKKESAGLPAKARFSSRKRWEPKIRADVSFVAFVFTGGFGKLFKVCLASCHACSPFAAAFLSASEDIQYDDKKFL